MAVTDDLASGARVAGKTARGALGSGLKGGTIGSLLAAALPAAVTVLTGIATVAAFASGAWIFGIIGLIGVAIWGIMSAVFGSGGFALGGALGGILGGGKAARDAVDNEKVNQSTKNMNTLAAKDAEINARTGALMSDPNAVAKIQEQAAMQAQMDERDGLMSGESNPMTAAAQDQISHAQRVLQKRDMAAAAQNMGVPQPVGKG